MKREELMKIPAARQRLTDYDWGFDDGAESMLEALSEAMVSLGRPSLTLTELDEIVDIMRRQLADRKAGTK